MIKTCTQIFHALSKCLFLNMDFKNHGEFERKYTIISLQRGRLMKLITFFVGIYSLYLDLLLHRDPTIDLIYRQTLLSIHIVILVLCLVYILIYNILIKSRRYRSSRITKAVILSDMLLSLLIAALLSINGQRFTGNLDAYMIVIFSISLVVPMYPKWVIGIYSFVHVVFLITFSVLFQGSVAAVRMTNSITMVLMAIVLFLVSYKYNVKIFLNEEMLKEDKATFIKLFEINPFPLMIASFAEGKIQYINRRAMSFYGLSKNQLGTLSHKDFYTNPSDLNIIYKILEANGVANNYAVEQKTASGQTKRPIVNYELIEYFGEKSILIGVTDIAEIKRVEHELTVHASMDVQTGVLNRRVGMNLVQKQYEIAKREKRGFILCFIDIDNLKMVNDTFGHLEGDALIADVCKIIKEEIKPHDLIFRYGGDEFMVLVNDDDEPEIDRTCRRIGERFEALNKSGYKPYPIDASIGKLSYKPEMELDLEEIIEMVDKNMYRSKLLKKQV